jgi:hypothetical protein
MLLREAFRRDFGIDIPLLSGHGGRADPFVLEAGSAAAAGAYAVRLVGAYLRGHALATQREACWKLLDSGPYEAGLQRYRFDVKWFSPTELVNETVSYFFAAVPALAEPWPEYVVGVDPAAGLRAGWKLGWLDFERRHDYPDPQLGYSLHWGAIGMAITVYVYRRELGDGTEKAAVDRELRDAVSSIADSKSEFRFHSELRAPAWCSEAARVALFRSEAEYSFLIVDRLNHHTVKLRATTRADERIALIGESLDAAAALFPRSLAPRLDA